MGNASSDDLEYLTAKKLKAAIRHDDLRLANNAIDQARKELIKPIKGAISTEVNDIESNIVAEKMIEYLTKEYELTEQGKKTLQDYCDHMGSSRIKDLIEMKIEEHRRILERSQLVRNNFVVGEVSHSRALEAKERLKAFRDKK
jgi:hypothetical protein